MASRRETCETSSKCTQRLARVKRWGKSPPLRWRHRRHGKPRVVQGQIGGESRPGSIKPSGRLLDPGSDTGTRGMIAATRSSLRELRAAQNPAYRLARHNSFVLLVGARDRTGAEGVEGGLAVGRWPTTDKGKIFLCVRLTESNDRHASPVRSLQGCQNHPRETPQCRLPPVLWFPHGS